MSFICLPLALYPSRIRGEESRVSRARVEAITQVLHLKIILSCAERKQVPSTSSRVSRDYLERMRDSDVVRPFSPLSLSLSPTLLLLLTYMGSMHDTILDMELGNYCSHRMSDWMVPMQRRIVPRQ